MILGSLEETILTTTVSRPFQKGTVYLFRSKGCKVTSCQSWTFEKKYVTKPESNHRHAAWVRVLNYLIILKVWLTVILQPFNLQRLAVPFCKYLDPVVNIVSAEESGLQYFKGRFCSVKVTPFA